MQNLLFYGSSFVLRTPMRLIVVAVSMFTQQQVRTMCEHFNLTGFTGCYDKILLWKSKCHLCV